jgi:hypothetical protein
MVVNGFELPAAFVQLCEAIRRGEAPKDWGLRENVDAYGQPWEVPDLSIYRDLEEIQSETDALLNMFLHEGRFEQSPAYANQPGFIADFTGVANFVWFGRASDGSPYCFDFGTDPKEPSVVHWDGYWRRVAPNFESFIALFVDIFKSPQWLEDEEDEEEEEEVTQLTGRIFLRNNVPYYVVGLRAALEPSFFRELARAYAEITPEEREAVEAEVREILKRDEAGGMKMTDERRWRLEEVWERLRATHRSD